MGFIDRVGAALKTYRTWRPQTLDELDAELERGWVSRTTHAGVSIDEHLVLNLSAVWSAVSQISQTVAKLPLKVFQFQGDGKRPYPQHSLYQVLHDQPNPQMTAFVWRERAMHHVLLWGNHYSEIMRDPMTGRVVAIWPFNEPWRMTPKIQNGKVVYEYRLSNSIPKIYPADRIFHIPGFGYDGRIGYSPITIARHSLGNALAADEAAGRVYKWGEIYGVI